METFFEAGRELPVAGTYDVIVAGSGPAGSCAAVTAGRLGARVLLIEWNNTVGGMSTSGLMSHWTGTVRSPLYAEILRRCAEKDMGTGTAEDPRPVRTGQSPPSFPDGEDLSQFTGCTESYSAMIFSVISGSVGQR